METLYAKTRSHRWSAVWSCILFGLVCNTQFEIANIFLLKATHLKLLLRCYLEIDVRWLKSSAVPLETCTWWNCRLVQRCRCSASAPGIHWVMKCKLATRFMCVGRSVHTSKCGIGWLFANPVTNMTQVQIVPWKVIKCETGSRQ